MLAALASAPLSALNVYGDELALCSKPGMAMTGFTRDGHCTDLDDDAGSHHICIQMWPGKVNFCNQTGQPDWCEEEMPCHEDASKTCPIKNWCVCQWAFEAYVQKVGCDAVVDLQCEAVNKVALDAYEEDTEAHKEALACLRKKCPDIPSGAKSSRTAVSSLQPLAHHDTASEACATCAANPNVDCYSATAATAAERLLVASDGCQSIAADGLFEARLLSTTSRLLSTTSPRRSTRWCWSRGARGRCSAASEARGLGDVRDVRYGQPRRRLLRGLLRLRQRKVPRGRVLLVASDRCQREAADGLFELCWAAIPRRGTSTTAPRHRSTRGAGPVELT